jgi:hypothetical protein
LSFGETDAPSMMLLVTLADPNAVMTLTTDLLATLSLK